MSLRPVRSSLSSGPLLPQRMRIRTLCGSVFRFQFDPARKTSNIVPECVFLLLILPHSTQFFPAAKFHDGHHRTLSWRANRPRWERSVDRVSSLSQELEADPVTWS